jgi:hypothetical protein
MSMRRRMRRQRRRQGGPSGRHRLDLKTGIGLALVALVGGVVLALSMYGNYGPGSHPDPRADVSSVSVVAQEQFSDEYIRGVYAAAAEIPEVLDGLFCYCRCRRHLGHRSVLTCFENNHGAECPVCLRSAALAHRMHAEGADLEAIRAAIDDLFGP